MFGRNIYTGVIFKSKRNNNNRLVASWGPFLILTNTLKLSFLKAMRTIQLSLISNSFSLLFPTTGARTHALTGIKAHPFFKHFDFGPSLRLNAAPYLPPIKHPTDTSNFEPVDDGALAVRQARHGRERGGHADDERLNHSNNSMLHEFTFRRFFDEATQSTDNFLYDRDRPGFTSLIRSIADRHEKIAEATTRDR